MFDVITIGAATRDVFLESEDFKFIESDEFRGGVGECLSLGSKNEVKNIFFSTGGGATNTAVTFARLGLKTATIARVGKDNAGDDITQILRQEKVNTNFIQKDNVNHTAYSTLLMYGPGERTILVYRGPSNNIEFPSSKLASMKAQWLYVTSLGGRIDLLRVLWNFAEKRQIKIAWNPGSEELKLGLMKLVPFIERCNVFNVNREEAARLTSCESQDEVCFTNKLHALARITLITDGKRGAFVYQGKEGFFVPSLGTKPRNTTGAGDAFGSGFVAGLILSKQNIFSKSVEGSAIQCAARLAILNADSVIREMGAKTGILKKMPNKKELERVQIKPI